jgi:hypothetical protein
VKSSIQVVGPLVLLCSCSSLLPSNAPKVLKSPDGATQLTVPGRWTVDNSLNQDASIHASNRFAEEYAIVVTESKEDLVDASLESYAKLSLTNQTKTQTDVTVSEPLTRTLGGLPAIQYEIHGTNGVVNTVMIQTAVEGATHFHVVKAWTLKSRWEDKKKALQEVVDSFRELQVPTPQTAEAVAEADPGITLKSADGAVRVTAPKGCTSEKKLNDQALLSVTCPGKDTFLIVIREAREDLAHMDLQKYSDVTRKAQMKGMGEASERPLKKRIVGGHPALEYELQGATAGVAVMMIHAVVESDRHYSQILAWTTKSRYARTRSTLQSMIDSYQD